MHDKNTLELLNDNLRDTSARMEQVNPKWAIAWPVARQCGSIALWLAVSLCLYMLSFPVKDPLYPSLFVVLIIYYARWYQRLLEIPLWAADTLRVLETSASADCQEHRRRMLEQESGRLPRFVVLIAAYKAQSSIEPVIRALKHQSYPQDRYAVYVVTQQAENSEKRAELTSSRARVLRSIRSEEPVRHCTETDDRIIERVFEAAMTRNGVAPEMAVWRAFVAARIRLGVGRRRIRAQLARKLIHNCFALREAGRDPKGCLEAFDLLSVRVGDRADRLIAVADTSLAAAHRIMRVTSPAFSDWVSDNTSSRIHPNPCVSRYLHRKNSSACD